MFLSHKGLKLCIQFSDPGWFGVRSPGLRQPALNCGNLRFDGFLLLDQLSAIHLPSSLDLLQLLANQRHQIANRTSIERELRAGHPERLPSNVMSL